MSEMLQDFTATHSWLFVTVLSCVNKEKKKKIKAEMVYKSSTKEFYEANTHWRTVLKPKF